MRIKIHLPITGCLSIDLNCCFGVLGLFFCPRQNDGTKFFAVRNIIKERSVYFMIECYKRILYIAILETGDYFCLCYVLCLSGTGMEEWYMAGTLWKLGQQKVFDGQH